MIPKHATAARTRANDLAPSRLLRKRVGPRTAKVADDTGSEPLFGATSSFLRMYRSEPLERVEAIKAGVSALLAVAVAGKMGVPKERLFTTLGISRATIDRKVRENKNLSADEGSRVLGMARLVGQVQAIVDESDNPEGFNAAEWIAGWLERPLPALGGRKPAEFMDTAEGQAMIANILERAQSGAYS